MCGVSSPKTQTPSDTTSRTLARNPIPDPFPNKTEDKSFREDKKLSWLVEVFPFQK